MSTEQHSNGLLIVNNLYLGTQRPALRFDDSFYEVVKSKLNKVIEYSNQENLTIIFTGVFTQKIWDTSVFSFLVETLQDKPKNKPVIVLDEPCLLRDGTVRSNTIPEVLGIVGIVDLVDQHNDWCSSIGESEFVISMTDPGRLVVHKKNDAKSKIIIKADDPLPPLVRTCLNEKDKPSSVLAITENEIKNHIVDEGLAPIDDVAFDLAEEIKTFDSELVERLQALMSRDSSSDEYAEGDADLRKLCEELSIPGEAKEILFHLKDEVNAEDL